MEAIGARAEAKFAEAEKLYVALRCLLVYDAGHWGQTQDLPVSMEP
jgi:hypothetical protein